jgi:hypothetical protein
MTFLEEKSFVYAGFRNNFDKLDVTGKSEGYIWSCAGSGVVPKPKDKSVNECLSGTTGIGYLEKRLVCNKCGYSQEIDD